MTTGKERILSALNMQESDRVPIYDSPWDSTIKRWHKEGLPEDTDITDYFGFDMFRHFMDSSFQLKEETIEETDSSRTYKDSNGATRRSLKNQETTPDILDIMVKDKNIWLEHKHLLKWNKARLDTGKELTENRSKREKGVFVCLNDNIGYDYMQMVVGSERLLITMLEDPEWAKDMFDTAVELLIESYERFTSLGFVFDGIFVGSDMGYKNASLFSPRIYKELLMPADKKMCDYFRAKKIPVILHSCGCVKELIPSIIEAGFSCLQGLEVKAGMDLIELKKAYGDKIAFMGGIDVRAMYSNDPFTIEKEISEKISFAKKGGGYIYHSDHSVPDSVSLAQFKRVLQLVNKYGSYK